MHTFFSRFMLSGVLMLGFANTDCNGTLSGSADISATIQITSPDDVNHVAPNQVVTMTVVTTGVTLVAPDVTPTPAEAQTAAYLQFYLDSDSSAVLLVAATATVMVTIPTGTPAGPHNVVCRVYKHDGTPTNTTFNLAITVQVTVGTDAGLAD